MEQDKISKPVVKASKKVTTKKQPVKKTATPRVRKLRKQTVSQIAREASIKAIKLASQEPIATKVASSPQGSSAVSYTHLTLPTTPYV